MSIAAKLAIIAPQFNSDPDRNFFIEEALMQVNRDWFGIKYETAVAYLAAHLLTLNASTQNNGGVSEGEILSKREGDLSVTYAKSDSSSGENFGQTSYGKQFIVLRQSSNVAIGIAGRLCQ